MFITTINNIEERLRDPPAHIEDSSPEEDEAPDDLGLRMLVGRVGAVRRFDSGVMTSSTPVKLATGDGVLRYEDTSGREYSTFLEEEHPPLDEPGNWKSLEPWTGKYVDDVNIEERLFLANATSVFSHLKERKTVRAVRCEEIFNTIAENASAIGMKVNPKKTRLLCVSSAIHSNVEAYVSHGDERIASGQSMVLLGFRFDSRPSVASHVDFIQEKVNARAWMLRHLRLSGVPLHDIVKIYSSVIRPVVEYVTPAFDSMLTCGQSDQIEAIQRRALKTIFGYKTSYRQALELAGLPTLKERRSEIVLKFANKTVANPAFGRWFPYSTPMCYDIRRKKKFQEEFAATDRLYRSPLFALRRLLNES